MGYFWCIIQSCRKNLHVRHFLFFFFKLAGVSTEINIDEGKTANRSAKGKLRILTQKCIIMSVLNKK